MYGKTIEPTRNARAKQISNLNDMVATTSYTAAFHTLASHEQRQILQEAYRGTSNYIRQSYERSISSFSADQIR